MYWKQKHTKYGPLHIFGGAHPAFILDGSGPTSKGNQFLLLVRGTLIASAVLYELGVSNKHWII
jgi:hypothetical protein